MNNIQRHCEQSEAIHHLFFRQKRSWIAASLTLLAMTIIALPAQADDAARKLELARAMHELRPVSEQVQVAIDQFAQTQAPEQREDFKLAMEGAFDIETLKEKSIQAYINTFTLEELEAMVEYSSKPEARSASDKFSNYAAIVYPEIVRMLDAAVMRIRTGGN